MIQRQKQFTPRNSSVELLRIIAMIMIVFHHFAVHGEFQWAGLPVSITHFWYNLILIGGKIGVNVFVIISGYYLINDDERIFNLRKTIKLVGQVFFYSFMIFMIGKWCNIADGGIKTFVKACFPITFSKWWFASAYFVLYLLHPFLNKLLRGLEKGVYRKFLLMLLICWSIIPTFTKSSYQSNSLLWFATLYSIAGYIRLYGLNRKFATKHYFGCLLICTLLTYASTIVFTILGRKWSIFASYITYFYGQEKITTFLISLCLFMVFASLKMNYHKWINLVASASFGVYLIHDNSIVRNFLWVDLFKNAQYQESLFLIPYSVIVVMVVYAGCTLIDLLRQRMIEKPFMMLVERYAQNLSKPFQKFFRIVENVIFEKEN